jgi:hypothetical protein
MIGFSNQKIGVLACVCLIGGAAAYAQTNRTNIFADDQEYYLTFKDLPEPNELATNLTLADAHVDRAFGAEYGEIADLTAIYCEKATALDAMEKSIAQLLTSIHFEVPSDWDPMFGTLRAALTARNVINSNPPEFQRVNLKVQIAQGAPSQRAFSMDYEVLSSPQLSSKSWSDVSSTTEARDYIERLKRRIRACIEQALRNHCTKAIVRDAPSEERALQAIATKFKMSPSEVNAIKALLGAQNEQ